MIVSGLKDTAIFYSRVFERQFPQLDVDGKINDLLQDFEKSNQQKEDAKEQTPNSAEPKNIATKQNYTNGSVGIYSLQSGAYSVRENAEFQKANLIIAGFSARVTELHRNNRVLYAVRIGYYNSKNDAGIIGSQIKTKLDIATIIVINN